MKARKKMLKVVEFRASDPFRTLPRAAVYIRKFVQTTSFLPTDTEQPSTAHALCCRDSFSRDVKVLEYWMDMKMNFELQCVCASLSFSK